jgi:hypothetical protein
VISSIHCFQISAIEIPKNKFVFSFSNFHFSFWQIFTSKKKRLTHNEELEGFISLVVEKVLASTNHFLVDPNARSDLSLP